MPSLRTSSVRSGIHKRANSVSNGCPQGYMCSGRLTPYWESLSVGIPILRYVTRLTCEPFSDNSLLLQTQTGHA